MCTTPGEIRANMGLGARKRAKDVTPDDAPNVIIPEDVAPGTTAAAFLATLVRCAPCTCCHACARTNSIRMCLWRYDAVASSSVPKTFTCFVAAGEILTRCC